MTWSDEAHFKLSDAVNLKNSVYYSTKNPHITIEGQLNLSGTTVWAGLSCKGVRGPIFSVQLLHTTCILTCRAEGHCFTTITETAWEWWIFFQPDGSPPHHTVTVCTFLDERLPNRWIGRQGSVERPPRSPDLTPIDFFFWGAVKVFSRKSRTVDDMIRRVREACQKIDDNKELCAKVCLSVASRLQECENKEGRQFEHLRDCTVPKCTVPLWQSFELIKLL